MSEDEEVDVGRKLKRPFSLSCLPPPCAEKMSQKINENDKNFKF
jgi:hypothetical protein